MCSPGYHRNGFVAIHTLGHMMYGCMVYIYVIVSFSELLLWWFDFYGKWLTCPYLCFIVFYLCYVLFFELFLSIFFSVWKANNAPSANPKYWTWSKKIPQKIVFLTKPLWNLAYDNFSHINARVTALWSHDHIYNIIWVTWQNLVGNVINRNEDITAFISKYLYFKKV